MDLKLQNKCALITGSNSIKVRAKMASEYAPNLLGRAGFPQEIADAVVCLASSRADYINGQNLRVDGGYVPTVN